MGIDISAAAYRVALFDIDLYSGMYQLDTEKQQESALMAFVLFNISDEIVTRENAGIAYQEGSNRVCILFRENWSRNFTVKTKEICLEIQQKTKEVMGFDVSMGIGKWVKSRKNWYSRMIWQNGRYSIDICLAETFLSTWKNNIRCRKLQSMRTCLN